MLTVLNRGYSVGVVRIIAPQLTASSALYPAENPIQTQHVAGAQTVWHQLAHMRIIHMDVYISV